MNRPVSLVVALAFGISSAHGAGTLERALNCQLKTAELRPLMKALAAEDASFTKASQRYGAPSVDVYKLSRPVTAHGLSSEVVTVAPARITLAVPGTDVKTVATRLGLESIPFSPSSREVRPGVSIVAYELSHAGLKGHVLVGCEYADQAATGWVSNLP